MTKLLPQEIAAALAFDAQLSDTPVVAGVGVHHQAQSIIRIARRYGIPLSEDQDLATQLCALREDTYVPEELFSEIAALLLEFNSE
ncbi:MAG: EscU/YscU/HrcU family type III secretion system export apparatus switch protein [Bdellovibrionota bacterium]